MSYYGHVLIQFGELDTASKLTKRALSIDQDCASCHLYRFEAMADRAKTMSHLRAMFQIPKMESELKTAYKLNPRLGDIQWGWIDLYLYLPATLGGGAGPARAHAEKLLAIDPVDGHLALAEIAKQQNDPTKELAQYRAAERQDTSDPRGAFALGKALYERGQYREAESYLSRAFALNHDSALYSAYRAADLVHLHRIEAAHHVVAVGNQTHPDSRLGDYLVAKALKAIDADLPWARELLASYLGVPPEPDQPTRSEARSLLAAIG